MLTHPFLTKLGVEDNLQELFAESYRIDKIGNLIFHYGSNEIEHFGFAFHLVPTCNNTWICGNLHLAREVFICSSAMEAISFAAISLHRFKNLDGVLFIAVGNKISNDHISWIKSNLSSKRVGLVFSSDILDQITDVKLALALSNLGAQISIIDEMVTLRFKEKTFSFNQANFTFSAFCKATSFRSGIRTYKSKTHSCFIKQLTSNI